MTDAATVNQIFGGFTPDMSRAAQVRAMVAAFPEDGEIVIAGRLANGGFATFCPEIGYGEAAALLAQALKTMPEGAVTSPPALKLTYGETSTGGGGMAMVSKVFTAISFDKVAIDTHASFDTASGAMTIKEAGFYLCDLNFRIADGDISGVSYGVGFGTELKDSPEFAWDVGNARRQGKLYQRVLHFNKDDKPQAFYYFDGEPRTYIAADFSLTRVL